MNLSYKHLFACSDRSDRITGISLHGRILPEGVTWIGKGERLPVNTEQSYEVPAKVSVRNERFGGLVYRYDNRALLFLHSRPLVDFLKELDGERPLGVALEKFAAERGLDDGQRQALENALGQLEGKGIIREL